MVDGPCCANDWPLHGRARRPPPPSNRATEPPDRRSAHRQPGATDVTSPILQETKNGVEPHLAPDLLIKMHDLMLKARLLEERLIRMQKQGDGPPPE